LCAGNIIIEWQYNQELCSQFMPIFVKKRSFSRKQIMGRKEKRENKINANKTEIMLVYFIPYFL